MQIRFKVKTSELNAALDMVAIVTPRPVVPQKNDTAGYLFIITGTKCFVYSRDTVQVARADFEVSEVEGEGAFILPAQHANVFRHMLSGEIEFEIINDGDTHTVKYHGDSSSERVSLDPNLLSTCDKDLDASSEVGGYSVALLREAFGLAKPFIAKDDKRAEGPWQVAQIFDGTQESTAKGNGHLYASDSKRSFYFYCEEFRDKGFAIHGKHLSTLSTFLAKCEGCITLRKGSNMMFAVDAKGRVFGWTHCNKTFSKFTYYSIKSDQLILIVPVATVLRALDYIKAELPADLTWIKVNFQLKEDDASSGTLTFTSTNDKCKATSFPVIAAVAVNAENRTSFSFGVGLEPFRNLFEGLRGGNVDLRLIIQPAGPSRPKDSAMFRTIDEFWLDGAGKNVGGSGANKAALPEGAVQCIATRFMPSMN